MASAPGYDTTKHPIKRLSKVAMLCIHSSPVDIPGGRDTGGMSVFIRELARELGNFGISVDVFTLCGNQSTVKIIPLSKNVRLICLDVNADRPITKEHLYDYLPAVIDAFIDVVRKEGMAYDIIHSHYWLSGIMGNQIKSLWDAAHVMTFHTLGAVKNYVCSLESESDFRIEQEHILAGTTDRIIVFTQNERQELVSFYDTPEENIGVVPAGVDFKLFRLQDKATARKKLGLNEKKQVLLYVGRNVPIKGLERLLTVIPDINRPNRFRLVIIGGDDENMTSNALIKRLKIQNSVTLIGRKKQELLPVYYTAADMLVMPSYHESFGLVGLESLACGTPVVSTPVGIMPTIINDKNGYILSKNNNGAIAEAIMYVADHQAKGYYDAKRIRTSICDYSWANTARAMVGEYQTILKYRETKEDE